MVVGAAVGLAVNVSVLVDVAGLGLNAAVTPLGRLLAVRLTLPAKPLWSAIVTVLVPVEPGTIPVAGLMAEAASVNG